jgi:hypothetical protein
MNMILDLTAHLVPLFAALTLVPLVSLAVILGARRCPRSRPAVAHRRKWPHAA